LGVAPQEKAATQKHQHGDGKELSHEATSLIERWDGESDNARALHFTPLCKREQRARRRIIE
jgi:hypothetical protein